LNDAILFLAKQNLAFRGHREQLDRDTNSGNFIELMKLIARYDPVVRQHLTSIRNSDKTTVSYLSPEIQNEFVELMGNQVRQEIVNDIKKAKYYAVLFDSTPDNSHTELFTQIV
jgi:uncharacterized protein (UPF0305 family)